MYGQTEASPRMSYLNYDMIEKKLGSIGRAIKNGKFYLVDSQKKNITKKNTIGELAYKGKNIMIGYANKSNDLEIMQKNKILYTGDLAKKDKDGYYYIVGRKSRFIKLFGSRISLDDLENKIKEDFEGKNFIIESYSIPLDIHNVKLTIRSFTYSSKDISFEATITSSVSQTFSPFCKTAKSLGRILNLVSNFHFSLSSGIAISEPGKSIHV